MKVGIVGLPYSGKTTLFEALTGAHGVAAEHSPGAHLATVAVPDERLDFLARALSPRKVTPAHVDFVDVAGVSSERGREHNTAVLSALREVDGLLHVVRFFDWPSAPPHPRGSLDPARDASEMQAELILADLDIVERRIEKLRKQVVKPTPSQEHDRKELALMERLREALEAGRRVGEVDLSAEEAGMLRSFRLLSEKPILPVLNVHEDEIGSEASRTAARSLGPDAIVVSARIEKEIAELDPAERGEFLEGMGLDEPADRRVIPACYRALGLRSFFTVVSDDLRAWTIQAGDTALTAAGKIHSDIARGFIRAEVVSFDDFRESGSMKEARTRGKARLEGKDYVVQDGDIITFRFKV